MLAILNIKWRRKSLIRVTAILLVISCLFSWTFIRKKINKDGRETVAGQNAKRYSTEIKADPFIVVTNSGRNSRRSQSIAEHNGSVLLGDSLGETPNEIQKSVSENSKEDAEKTTLVDVAKSRSSPLDSVVASDALKDKRKHSSENQKSMRVYKSSIPTRIENNLSHNHSEFKENNRANSEQFYMNMTSCGGVRQSLIIVAQARTGSSFLGDAFNQHPDVFYLFEPLHGVNPPSHNNDANSMKFLEGILHCKFNSAKYVKEIDRFRRYSSKALSSPPLCESKTYVWTLKKNCTVLDPFNMEAVCKSNYSATVIKILTSRIPSYKLDSLFPLCNSSINCSLLYLVRDPRPIIFSHMKVGMIAWDKISNVSALYKDSPRPLIRLYATQMCQQIEANIKIFQNLPRQMKNIHYMLRYEDLARDPTETLTRVYKMVGLEMTNVTLRWIRIHTGEGRARGRDEKNEFSTKRNSKAVIDKWRFEMDPCVVEIVEESCRSVMKLLGYKPINRSEKVQYDLNISLSNGY